MVRHWVDSVAGLHAIVARQSCFVSVRLKKHIPFNEKLTPPNLGKYVPTSETWRLVHGGYQLPHLPKLEQFSIRKINGKSTVPMEKSTFAVRETGVSRGAQLGAPLNPSNRRVLWCRREISEGGPQWGPTMKPGNASLSDSYKFDRCCFSRPVTSQIPTLILSWKILLSWI